MRTVAAMKRALNVPDSIGDEGVQERVKIGLARKSGPTRFMIVHKDSDLDFVAPKVHELVQWLGGYKSHDGRSPQQIIVCPDVLRDTLRSETDIVKFVGHENMVTDEVDLIITMGGDGTVLLAAWLFQEKAPPIVPFHFGTLGFLTLFHWDNFAERLGKILREGSRFNTRMRLNCRVHRTRDGVVSEHNVLNEIVVERGASPFMCVLDLFGDGIYLTTVQADGAAVATPTGSTAYSVQLSCYVAFSSLPRVAFCWWISRSSRRDGHACDTNLSSQPFFPSAHRARRLGTESGGICIQPRNRVGSWHATIIFCSWI